MSTSPALARATLLGNFLRFMEWLNDPGKWNPCRCATAVAYTARSDERVVACRELPLGRADLPARQSANRSTARAFSHQAPASWPLGHNARLEFHLRPS